MKAATNLSGIQNILYFQRNQHTVFKVKSPCSELKSVLLLSLLSREGELGRIIVDKKPFKCSEYFLFSKFHFKRLTVKRLTVKSPAYPCFELLLLLCREGELGRIIVDKQLSHTGEHNSYQNAGKDNSSDINGEESGQNQSQSRGQSNYQTGEDLLQYHISCFRCYVCFKILKERYGKGAF